MTLPNAKLNVSTVNLSADLDGADENFGLQDRGAMEPEELGKLLEKFSQLDEIQNHSHEPRVKVSCPEGEFSVRMTGGKLFLYHTHDSSQPPADLDVPGLLEVFTNSASTGGDSDETEDGTVKPGSATRGWLALGLLLVGLGLNAWALNTYFQPDPVWPPPVEATAVSDPATLAQYSAQLPGTYATGEGAGHRLIVLSPDQSIKFQLMGNGPPGTIGRESHDAYTLGRQGEKTLLVTQRFGGIEVRPDGSLLHVGDHYTREEPEE